MTVFTPADTLHRLVKQALDSGAAASIAEAEALFAGYRLGLRIAPETGRDPHHQAALLTAVALGRRVFLGGVSVAGTLDVPLLAPLSFGTTLAEAVIALGGIIGEAPERTPLIDIGGEPLSHPRGLRGLARRDRVGAHHCRARAGADHGAGTDARCRAGRQ